MADPPRVTTRISTSSSITRRSSAYGSCLKRSSILTSKEHPHRTPWEHGYFFCSTQGDLLKATLYSSKLFLTNVRFRTRNVRFRTICPPVLCHDAEQNPRLRELPAMTEREDIRHWRARAVEC